MGAGIAQVAAQAGWTVQLIDSRPDAVSKAIAGIGKNFDRLVEKGKLTAAQRDHVRQNLHESNLASLGQCELVIEAVIEDMQVKAAVFKEALGSAPPTTILASNT